MSHRAYALADFHERNMTHTSLKHPTSPLQRYLVDARRYAQHSHLKGYAHLHVWVDHAAAKFRRGKHIRGATTLHWAGCRARVIFVKALEAACAQPAPVQPVPAACRAAAHFHAMLSANASSLFWLQHSPPEGTPLLSGACRLFLALVSAPLKASLAPADWQALQCSHRSAQTVQTGLQNRD